MPSVRETLICLPYQEHNLTAVIKCVAEGVLLPPLFHILDAG